MAHSDATLTIHDVVARTGINPITLRSWTQAAVVPRGIGRARGTRYTETHVLKILAAQSFRAQGLGLEQVAYRIRRLSDEDLAAFVRGTPVSTSVQPTPAADASAPPVAVEASAPAPVSPSTSPAESPSVLPHATDEGVAPVVGFRAMQHVALFPGLTLVVDPAAGEFVQRIANEIATKYGVRS